MISNARDHWSGGYACSTYLTSCKLTIEDSCVLEMIPVEATGGHRALETMRLMHGDRFDRSRPPDVRARHIFKQYLWSGDAQDQIH